MDTHTQRFGDKRAATRTFLAGVAWVNLQEQSTSICRFVGCELRKLAPSNVSNALVEFVAKDLSVITHHLEYGKLFRFNRISCG